MGNDVIVQQLILIREDLKKIAQNPSKASFMKDKLFKDSDAIREILREHFDIAITDKDGRQIASRLSFNLNL